MSEVMADATAGTLLRRAREAAGLHVAALAVSLKVPVRKLEALEQDQYDQLTDAVFARALASSVCRTLKIDAQPVLERLPQTHAPRLVHDHAGLNAPFRAPGDREAPGWADHLTKPVFLAVFALLLGALVLIFLPTARTADPAAAKADPGPAAPLTPAALTPAPATDVPVAASPDTVPVPVPASQATAPATLVPAAEVAAAGAPTRQAAPRDASDLALKPIALTAQPAAPSAQPASSAAAVGAPSAPGGVVVFRTTGPSWIEVIDGRGTVALRRLMAAGESAGASGNLPLTVTIGSVNATSVQVRGKPYDLAKVSRDNVARFEVK